MVPSYISAGPALAVKLAPAAVIAVCAAAYRSGITALGIPGSKHMMSPDPPTLASSTWAGGWLPTAGLKIVLGTA
jgi:hypothetical protein